MPTSSRTSSRRSPKLTSEQQQSAVARATRLWRLAIGISSGLLVLGTAMLVLTMVFITIADRSALTNSAAPLYLVADDRTPAGKWLVGAPGVLLLLAVVLAWMAELSRRATWARVDRSFLKGGSNTVDLVALPVRIHLAGTGGCLLAWAVLILGPALSQLAGGWPGILHPEALHAAWSLLVAYGGISAGLAAASGASLLKKLTYAGRAERGRDSIVAGSVTTRFWRWFSFRWRFEIWIAGVAGALLGGTPVAMLFAPPLTWSLLGGVGLVLALLAAILCLNAWRSGESLYRGESVS